MTNVVLGHCYTTENKGDAGIVLATIETIKAHSPGVRIKGISTFSSRDDAFLHHHQDYEAAGAQMVPALLPEDKLYVFGRVLSSSPAKLLSFIKNSYLLIQGFLLYRINPAWSFGDVGRAFKALDEADIFVSKGGSFIYNEGGFRGDISLFKLLVPFWAAKAMGVRTIILAQSLGPFNTPLSQAMFKFFLRYMDRIYLREDRCLRYLKYMPESAYAAKIDSCPDLAFALSSEGYASIFDARDGHTHVGLTIVNHRFANEQARQAYINILGNAVDLLRQRFADARFHVFPQVLSPAVDGTVELELSREVLVHCKTRHGIDLEVIEGDFDARVLRESYRQMQFFVATRLHSSIFAASVGVPTIVFGYHGTKAEGIWNDLGFGKLFFDINSVTWQQVEQSLNSIIDDKAAISAKLLSRTMEWRTRINEVVHNELAHTA